MRLSTLPFLNLEARSEKNEAIGHVCFDSFVDSCAVVCWWLQEEANKSILSPTAQRCAPCLIGFWAGLCPAQFGFCEVKENVQPWSK